MELSNCLQLHTLKRFIFLLVGRQDNLPDNFGKCSLGCPRVLEDALALLNCVDAFSPLFTPHRTFCSKISCQAYLWKGFTYFNKKGGSTVIWCENKHGRFSRDKDGNLSIWAGPPEQLNVFKQRDIGK